MSFLMRSMAFVALTGCAASAMARDTVAEYSVAEAIATEQAKSILGANVKYYFGETAHGKVVKKFGEYSTNRKTNGVGKTDKAACEWAFLSAMKVLRESAERNGANAVVNIRSNYKNVMTNSSDTFKCGSGAIMSGVALVGDVVTTEDGAVTE